MLFVHYPKCSTCVRAKNWLSAHGKEFESRDIKTENPTADELRLWYQKSGMPLKKFFNTSGMLYREMGLKDKLPTMTEEERSHCLPATACWSSVPLWLMATPFW